MRMVVQITMAMTTTMTKTAKMTTAATMIIRLVFLFAHNAILSTVGAHCDHSYTQQAHGLMQPKYSRIRGLMQPIHCVYA